MTHTRFDNIKNIWNDNSIVLVGISGHYCQMIGRDQAVDEEGNSNYNSFRFENAEGTVATYTARFVENFAKTW